MKAVFEKGIRFNLLAKKIKGFEGYPLMFHSHCELIYVVDGKIDMVIDGVRHTLKEGEISITFPYVTHCYENAPDAEVIILLFDVSATGLFEASVMTKKPTFPFTDKLSHLLPIFERIVELSNEEDSVNKKTASAYLSAVIGEILKTQALTNTTDDTKDVLYRVLNYCSEHFCDDDISIGKISEALYVSPSYVSKIFSGKLKYKFREYINILKINHAKKLLAEKETKILDVMFRCGFKNQSSFNRIFIDLCGISPSEYRKGLNKNK